MNDVNIDLKSVRKLRGLSQKEVSEKTGYTQANISKIEAGQIEFMPLCVKEYLKAIGVKVYYTL
mgnify:CR=1 FL=1